MKDYLKKLLKKLNERKETLEASIIEAETKEERAEIGATLKDLKQEIEDAENALAEVEAAEGEDDGADIEGASDDSRRNPVGNRLDMRSVQTNSKNAEKRAQEFAKSHKMTISQAEARSVLVSSGQIATPTAVHGINDALGAISTVVDAVSVVNAEGMGTDLVAYEKAGAVADVTNEGDEYNASDPEFGFVEITPQTVTVLCYISKQVRKQSPLTYQNKVETSALAALKKKAARIVIAGIINSDLIDKMKIEAIDETTLRKIAFNYGGENAVLGNAELYLCKEDLVKFGDVRGENEKAAVYEITPDSGSGNTGTIKDGGLTVRYRLVSVTEGVMTYGQPLGYQLDMFSDYEINVSDDYKINKGLLTIVGDVQLGGAVVVDKGFTKITVNP